MSRFEKQDAIPFNGQEKISPLFSEHRAIPYAANLREEMMTNSNKRSHKRVYYEAPITYSKHSEKGDHDATMYNISSGGMYFESDHALRRGVSVYIRMINFSPYSYIPGAAYKTYVARVVWCKKTSDPFVYGIGVCYIARGHIVQSDLFYKLGNRCDLCKKKISSGELHKTEGALALHLCPSCFKQLGELVDGDVGKHVPKFGTEKSGKRVHGSKTINLNARKKVIRIRKSA